MNNKFFERFPLHKLKSAIFKPDQQSATKAKSIFADAQYRHENGDLIAEICHLDDFPMLKIYTSDPVLKAKAQAKLTAKYMVDLYISFMQFLPAAARLKSGQFMDDPIAFVAEEIRQRKLNFSYVDKELHYMLVEFNAYITEHNQTVYPWLTVKPFTMDDLKAFLALCDVYKGIGCSAALRKTEDGDLEFIRNLDWEPIEALGNHTLGLMTYTGHENPERPQYVFSISFTPGMLGLSMVNDKGLIITLNEATKMHTKRENAQPNAIPQFVLVRQLIENCVNLDEVKAYLQKNQPATSHILSVMDAHGNFGIFEMLPNKGPFANELYHFRKPSEGSVHVSNHFLNGNEQAISDTEGFDCSFDRFDKMMNALKENKNSYEIASSTNVHDSIQTLIFTRSKDNFNLKINWSNGYSATAVDPTTKQLHYTEIDINNEFNNYAKQVAKQNMEEMTKIHQSLFELMQTSHKVGHAYPQLGSHLNALYSELLLQLSNGSKSETEVQQLVDEASDLITKISYTNDINSKGHRDNSQLSADTLLSLFGIGILSAILGSENPKLAALTFVSLVAAYQKSDDIFNFLARKPKDIICMEKVMSEVNQITADEESYAYTF